MDFSADSRKLIGVSGGGEREILMFNIPKNKSEKIQFVSKTKSHHTAEVIRLIFIIFFLLFILIIKLNLYIYTIIIIIIIQLQLLFISLLVCLPMEKEIIFIL